MRCGRCGKIFDEEMYSRICPKCGFFQNKRAEVDVSQYFSARFEDDKKVSTAAQAARQHDRLHEMYDKYNMHKPMARQGQGGFPGQKNYGQAKLYEEKKKRNFLVPVFAAIMVLAVAGTAALCNVKKQQVMENYQTLEYERQTAGVGELFEISGWLLTVREVKAMEMSSLPAGEKLVAVSVEILPANEDSEYQESATVYVFDGVSCKEYLDSYVVEDDIFGGAYFEESDLTEEDILDGLYSMQESMGAEILTGYNYLGYGSKNGRMGAFYFLVDEAADEITISFDETNEENDISILQKRVSVPLQLGEDEA